MIIRHLYCCSCISNEDIHMLNNNCAELHAHAIQALCFFPQQKESPPPPLLPPRAKRQAPKYTDI